MSFSSRNIETPDMPDRSQTVAAPAALPFVYPLDEFYARAGLPLPRIERIQGEAMPEPYRSLLVHERDMTPTLENFHSSDIHLKILKREQRDDFYFREVVLLLNGSDMPVEFGANKVSLALFPPKARQLILDERVPLGRILKDCDISHATFAKAFFRVAPDELISSVLNLNSPTWLYGRKATIFDAQKRPLSEIVEILPASSKKSS
jgi:chorismate-pyruvate lyase